MTEKIKVEVLRPYRNKYTKSIHQAGDFLEVSEKRFEEVNNAGHGELLRKVDDGEAGDSLEIFGELFEEVDNVGDGEPLVEDDEEEGD